MLHFQSLVNNPFGPSQVQQTIKLQLMSITLATYSGDNLHILGTYNVQVGYKGQLQTLPLVVVQGPGPSFFGRNWLEKIKIDWNSIYSVQNSQYPLSLINNILCFLIF